MNTLTPERFHELATNPATLFFRCLVDFTPAKDDPLVRGPQPRGPLVKIHVVVFYEDNYYSMTYSSRHDGPWDPLYSMCLYDKVLPGADPEDEDGLYVADVIEGWSHIPSWDLDQASVVMMKEPVPAGSPLRSTWPMPDYPWLLVMHVMRMSDRLTQDEHDNVDDIHELPREVREQFSRRTQGLLRELFNRRSRIMTGTL